MGSAWRSTTPRPWTVPRLNPLAGIAPEGVDPDDLTQVMVDNLRFAAAACAAQGITLLIEPINTTDIPGFFLCHTEQAVNINRRRGSRQPQTPVRHLPYADHGGEPWLRTIEAHLDLIGHLQLADNPGRHEPGSGDIHFPVPLSPHRRAGICGLDRVRVRASRRYSRPD